MAIAHAIQSVRSDTNQSFAEYKEAQDVTAPPDPVAEGTTSDVPIRGEKTNVLFHPTPAISFKPMFEELQKRATGLCVGFSIGILFLGRMFGGSLWGLVPLTVCVVSGVWLWMQEVIREGRELEWSSEQLRGQTVWLTPWSLCDRVMLIIDGAPRLRRTSFPNPLNG